MLLLLDLKNSGVSDTHVAHAHGHALLHWIHRAKGVEVSPRKNQADTVRLSGPLLIICDGTELRDGEAGYPERDEDDGADGERRERLLLRRWADDLASAVSTEGQRVCAVASCPVVLGL